MSNKKCSKCGIEKPITDFYKNKSCKDGLSAYCKTCSKDARKKYLDKYPEKVNARIKQYRETHRVEMREYAKNKYYANLESERERQRLRQREKTKEIHNLKTPCVKCGESRKYVIDFHHIDPTQKKYDISQIVKNTTQLSEELVKCVCLCRNCHSEFHWLYGTTPEKPVESLTEYLGVNPYSVTAGGIG